MKLDGLEEETMKMQIDHAETEFRTVRFETPPPPPITPLEAKGSAEKPIVIDDSDDE